MSENLKLFNWIVCFVLTLVFVIGGALFVGASVLIGPAIGGALAAIIGTTVGTALMCCGIWSLMLAEKFA